MAIMHRGLILLISAITLANFLVSHPSETEEYDNITSIPSTRKELPKRSHDPCSLQVFSNETFWFAVAAWNFPGGLHRALESVRDQVDTGYRKLHVVVMEDLSENMFTLQDEERYNHEGSNMQVTFLRKGLVTQKLGSAGGKWVAFEFIRKHALPHEYVFVLDGDDLLPDETTVSYIHKRLSASKPWFAWGKHQGKWSNQCHGLTASTTRNVRSLNWGFCHPRIFVAHLLQKYFVIEDLQTPTGEWLQKSTDAAFIYKFLEVSGKSRIQYLGDERPLYKYIVTKDNGVKVFKRDVVRAAKELVRNRKPADEAVDTVHVIVACDVSPSILESLKKSKLPSHNSNVHYSIHACDTYKSNAVAFPAHMSMTIHKNLHSGLALAQELSSSEYVDYVIFVESKANVQPQTLADIYRARQPKTYSEMKDPFLSIVDASIFRFPQAVREQPPGVGNHLWLSQMAQTLGWKTKVHVAQQQQRQLSPQDTAFQKATQKCQGALSSK